MSVFLSARIEEAVNTRLCAIANQECMTKTEVIKKALDLYLKNSDAKLVKQMEILHKLDNSVNYDGINHAL